VANGGQQNTLVFKCVSLIEMVNLLPAIRVEVADVVNNKRKKKASGSSSSQIALTRCYCTDISTPSASRSLQRQAPDSELQSIKLP